MILFALLNYLSGYRDIICDPSSATDIVNIIMKNKLDYWKMRRNINGELKFSMLNSEYKKMLVLFGEKKITGIKSEKEHGLPFLIKRYRHRIGIPIGIFMFVFLMKLSTMYVWDVRVMGNERITDAEIIEALDELGCSIGTYIPSVDFYNICHEFILNNKEISWISVNMIGTTARVDVIERKAKTNLEDDGNGTPTNLVAARDGIIVRTETAEGTTSVKIGEKVSKGQLLVNGVVDVGQNENKNFVLVRSRGKIFARTERSFEISVPYERIEKTLINKNKVYEYINFFGKSIKIKENSGILENNCDIIEKKNRIVLFEGNNIIGGIALPISVVMGYSEEYSEEKIVLSDIQALSLAKSEMTELFSSEMQDAEIISRTEQIDIIETENSKELVLTWNVVCVENIAEEIPIGVS